MCQFDQISSNIIGCAHPRDAFIIKMKFWMLTSATDWIIVTHIIFPPETTAPKA